MIRISRRWYPQCVRHAKTSCTWLCTAAITPFRAEKRKAANNAAAEKMSELNQGQEEIPASGLCMGFSLLRALEFFVFRKMEMPETKTHLLCGWSQIVIQKITFPLQ